MPFTKEVEEEEEEEEKEEKEKEEEEADFPESLFYQSKVNL